MIKEHRAGEDGPIPSRHERIFQQPSGWFFNTREGTPIGPFASQAAAEQGLHDFVEFIRLAEPEELS